MESVGKPLAPEGWPAGGWKGEAEIQRFVGGRTVSRRIIVPLIIK